MKQLTHALLLEQLSYDPKTGIFLWRTSPSRGTKAGSVAGFKKGPYWAIRLFGNDYQAHRIAWFYMTSSWPEFEIDHEDTDKRNNRWGNLRDLPHAINMQNVRRARSDNQSKLIGAHKRKGRFTSCVEVGDARIFLGSFKTAEEANAMFVAVKREVHEGCTL